MVVWLIILFKGWYSSGALSSPSHITSIHPSDRDYLIYQRAWCVQDFAVPLRWYGIGSLLWLASVVVVAVHELTPSHYSLARIITYYQIIVYLRA